jgi:nucleotide-binding universal stress UspA family protein
MGAMGELRNRIAVGLDGSPAARRALAWAGREALRTGSVLLVVTAWTAQARAGARERGELPADRIRLQRMQLDCLAEALDGLPEPPAVARELVLADPITAMCHAAGYADMLVLGVRGEEDRPTPTAGLVARRLARRGDIVPVVAIPAVAGRSAADRALAALAGAAAP